MVPPSLDKFSLSCLLGTHHFDLNISTTFPQISLTLIHGGFNMNYVLGFKVSKYNLC